MFIGECLCLICYYLWMCIRYTSSCRQQCKIPLRHCLLFLLPALLDVVATACAYTGLNLTYASSFEMLKGDSFLLSNFLNLEDDFINKFSPLAVLFCITKIDLNSVVSWLLQLVKSPHSY